jgi:predicted enzyme related to lactoylglutathione lyase
MANQQGSFIWYELMTGDPRAAKRFYDPVVGWSIQEETVAPGLEYRMIGRSDGGNAGGVMTLNDEMRANGARPVWLGYLHVSNVDSSVEAMQADGGRIMMPPWDQPGVGRLAMVTDPQGAPFYLMDPEPPADNADAVSDVFSVDQPQHVRWNELATTDPAAAIAFYARHFGWRQEGEMDMGELGRYQFLHRGDTMIGAVMPKMPRMPASTWSFYIGVDDIDRATAAVRSGGGQVLQEPIEIPDGEYSINAVDPQGAAFGLVGPRHN